MTSSPWGPSAQYTAEEGHAAVRAVDVEIQLRADQQAPDGGKSLASRAPAAQKLGALQPVASRYMARLGKPAEQVDHTIPVLQRHHAPAIDRGTKWRIVLHREPAAVGIEPQFQDFALQVPVEVKEQPPRACTFGDFHDVAIVVFVLHGRPMLEELVYVQVIPSHVEGCRPVPLPVCDERPAAHGQTGSGAAGETAAVPVEEVEGDARSSNGQKKWAVAITVWCPSVTWNLAFVVTDDLKYDSLFTTQMQASSVGTGNFSPMMMPRSNSLASSAATQSATRSPCWA
eukprot:CAMPEP_0179208890 /NCGR_PEP_ID=MMETSP0796-20121207/104177_1 /TAXON_ID=73915 /ORGANISM="Pyrodinium bahamense, Strain pbaha01" /LENGTH=285 /DNA_ID=CAMNT_0020913843 /DNA_START=373 /DNA_END=1228 /DNA_ORIENTATION=-